MAVLLHQRFRLGGQAAVRLSVGQRGQYLSPGRTLYRSQKALQIGGFGQRVQINAAALLQKVRQAVQVIAGAACIQAAQRGGQLIDLAAERQILVDAAACAAVIPAQAVEAFVLALPQQVLQLGAAGVGGVYLGQRVGVQRQGFQLVGQLCHCVAIR